MDIPVGFGCYFLENVTEL